jgi:hypothetical protein
MNVRIIRRIRDIRLMRDNELIWKNISLTDDFAITNIVMSLKRTVFYNIQNYLLINEVAYSNQN